ncbi:phosphatidylserine/phosphatidylglycerophosphate/cardiolipin synthase family protein [Natribaculum luteum]|uniref:Phosphatidylserine/phosphatidylglycerophosphate/ cardiolipin synthase family protein n=1 Tax=Natribaculum luteum TaxID=1586232 RepID=A0ABD5P0Q4_9EURY|nr:phospholipase D-like domain-containing protein [Natribaculum luteum]
MSEGYHAEDQSRSTGRRRFLQVVGAGLAATTTGRVEATQAGSPPAVQPIFSYPTADRSPDDRHETVVTRLLERAAPESSVYCSLFTLTRDKISGAFVAAADRGVDVNILIDEQSMHRSATRLLLDELPDRAAVVTDGGVGDRHNHNKFLLLEELDTGDENVVWQSSSNMTSSQLYNHNASVVVRNDRPLYEAYRDYWADLADGSQNLAYNRTEHGDSASVYFSPRDDFDTHIAALEDVVPSWKTRIHFMQSIWTSSREAESELIDRLAELVEAGSEVRVVVQKGDEVVDRLREAGVDVVAYPSGDVGVHSKYMLVESDFETESGDTERRREVWTGSQNLSRPGLRRNDEALLRFVDDYVYNEFLDDWERIHRRARRIDAETESRRTDSDTTTQSDPPTSVNSARTTDMAMRDAIEPDEQSGWRERGYLYPLLATAAGGLAGSSYLVRRRLRSSGEQ